MTTLAAVIALVRERLDEPSERFYDDTTALTPWINAAIKDIARRTELYQTRATVAVVAGTQEYVLATDMIRLSHLQFKPTGSTLVYPLVYRDSNTMDDVWSNGMVDVTRDVPTHYTLWGSPPTLAAILWPVPAAAGTLTVWYFKQPAETTNPASELPLPMGWDDAVVDYCEYNALRKARDSRWQEAKQLYEEKVAELHDKTVRYTDQSGQVVGAGGYGGLPSWLTDW